MSRGVVIEPRPTLAPRLGPWERHEQSWVRRYLTGDAPGPIAVCACNNREGGWHAFSHAEDGALGAGVIVPQQPRKAALAAIDAALGLTP